MTQELDRKQHKQRKLLIDKHEDITPEIILNYIHIHEQAIERYETLEDEFYSVPPILDKDNPAPKPNEKYVVSHGRYLQGMFDGFAFGKAPKITIKDSPEANEKLTNFQNADDFEYKLTQLAKYTSIYSNALLLYYLNEESEVRTAVLNPKNAFIVYDTTSDSEKVFGVTLTGDKITVSDNDWIVDYEYNESGELEETERKPNQFGKIPLVEYVQNEERIGLYEPVMTLINAFNKVLSNKGDDVEYFADNYLHLDTPTQLTLSQDVDFKSNRIINTFGDRPATAQFLTKPSADETQENLLNRLSDLIMKMTNVVDLADEGVESGASRKTRLQNMRNQALNKQAEFQRAMNEGFELYFSVPMNGSPESVSQIEYTWYLNEPEDIATEAQVARTLKGIISDRTLFERYLSGIDPDEELQRMADESEPLFLDYSDSRTGEVDEQEEDDLGT